MVSKKIVFVLFATILISECYGAALNGQADVRTDVEAHGGLNLGGIFSSIEQTAANAVDVAAEGANALVKTAKKEAEVVVNGAASLLSQAKKAVQIQASASVQKQKGVEAQAYVPAKVQIKANKQGDFGFKPQGSAQIATNGDLQEQIGKQNQQQVGLDVNGYFVAPKKQVQQAFDVQVGGASVVQGGQYQNVYKPQGSAQINADAGLQAQTDVYQPQASLQASSSSNVQPKVSVEQSGFLQSSLNMPQQPQYEKQGDISANVNVPQNGQVQAQAGVQAETQPISADLGLNLGGFVGAAQQVQQGFNVQAGGSSDVQGSSGVQAQTNVPSVEVQADEYQNVYKPQGSAQINVDAGLQAQTDAYQPQASLQASSSGNVQPKMSVEQSGFLQSSLNVPQQLQYEKQGQISANVNVPQFSFPKVDLPKISSVEASASGSSSIN